MKYWSSILLLVLLACNNQPKKAVDKNATIPDSPANVKKTETPVNNEQNWEGTIDGKIPVFLHYKIDSNLVIGEITYLNTTERQAIPLLGTIAEGKNFRLLEFEKSGNITGIITGLPSGSTFNGIWFSPKTRKELTFSVARKDTIISPVNTDVVLKDVFGHYHYQYTNAGYQGDLEISKHPNGMAVFGISSVTSEPARNIAQVDDDTIALSSSCFVYKIPNTDSCEFEVKFYKGFAYVRYTKGYCNGQFGMNATIDGIFMKTR